MKQDDCHPNRSLGVSRYRQLMSYVGDYAEAQQCLTCWFLGTLIVFCFMLPLQSWTLAVVFGLSAAVSWLILAADYSTPWPEMYDDEIPELVRELTDADWVRVVRELQSVPAGEGSPGAGLTSANLVVE